MPGISLINAKENANDKSVFDGIKQILDSQNFIEGYKSEVIYEDKKIFLGSNSFENYPVSWREHNDFIVVLEGKIYNKDKSQYETELNNILMQLLSENVEIKLSDWLQKTDGDFVVYAYNQKTEDLWIFNDIFGRLPFYYSMTYPIGFIASRYLSFINKVSENTNNDDMGIAQFLLFGYPLGRRTIYKDVHQLTPATLLYIGKNQVFTKKLYNFNFQKRKYTHRSNIENLENLMRLFSEACKNRFTNESLNVLTLSGGLDSRLIAACMHKENIPFSVATLRYTRGSKVQDEKFSEQVSRLFNSEYNVMEVEPPDGKDLLTLLNIKDGMNSLFTAQMIPFYKKVKSVYSSNINFITGDNGDRLIYSINRPLMKFLNIDDLVNFILQEHTMVDFDFVTEFTRLSQKEIKDELKWLLESFSETDLTQKYIHFRVIHKPHKYAFQGEDRHRHYFWAMSPFWSFPFYDYIMNCSDKSKHMFRLFSSLLGKYSFSALKIPYANYNTSTISLRGKLFMLFIYYIQPLIPNKLKSTIKNSFFGGNPLIDEKSPLIRCLKEQSTITINSNFNKLNIDELKKIRKITLFNILTITSAIEKTLYGRSSLKKYSEEKFY